MNQGERQVPHELCPQLTISRNRMAKAPHVRWFDSISLKDLAEVSGKNASIGELSALLAADSGRVPEGFALTAHVDQQAVDAAGAWPEWRRLVSNFDHR